MTEEWRDVVGYEGLYEVSSLGRVRSTRTGLMTPQPAKNGYPIIKLRRDGKRTTHTLHGVVARAFLGPTPIGLEVRHDNGDRDDARVANLLFGTRSENNHDQVRHGTHANGSKTHCPSGHEYTPENTGRPPSGGRYCRKCKTVTNSKRDQRKRPIEARK